MKIYCDPTPEQLADIFSESEHNAAKWIKADGKMWFWKPEDGQHAQVAHLVGATTYEKGLAVPASTAAN